MQYELQYFHQLIHSDYKVTSLQECLNFLQMRFEQPLLVSLMTITPKNKDLKITEVDQYYFLAAEKLVQLFSTNISDITKSDFAEIKNLINKKLSYQPKNIRVIQNNDHQFQAFIEQDINYQNLDDNEVIFHYFDLKIDEEYDKIIYNFQRNVFNSNDATAINLYIRNHQYDIQKLLNLLLQIIIPEEQRLIYKISKEWSKQDLYKITYHYLERIAQYLYISFSKYADNEVEVPYYIMTGKAIVWKSQLKEIVSNLDEKVSQGLNLIFINLVDEINSLTIESSFSFSNVEYFDKFLSNLSGFLNGEEIDEKKFIHFLIKQNFNPVPLVEFITENISDKLAGEVSVDRKLKILYQYRKSYGQVQIENMSYKSGASLQNMLLDWLEEEIDFLQKLHQLKHLLHKEALEDKLETQMSVPELSYYVRLQHDLGIIKNKNLTFIAEKFTKHINTRKKDNPAAKNFRKKFYEVEDSTRASVRRWLVKMLKQVDKELGYGETSYDR